MAPLHEAELTAVPSPSDTSPVAELLGEGDEAPAVLVEVTALAANPWLIIGAWLCIAIAMGLAALNPRPDCMANAAGIAARAWPIAARATPVEGRGTGVRHQRSPAPSSPAGGRDCSFIPTQKYGLFLGASRGPLEATCNLQPL